MNVTVRLFATLRQISPSRGDEFVIDVPDGTTVADLIARLDIPEGIVRKAFVCGVAREDSYVLNPDDEIGMFPPIAGGV